MLYLVDTFMHVTLWRGLSVCVLVRRRFGTSTIGTSHHFVTSLYLTAIASDNFALDFFKYT